MSDPSLRIPAYCPHCGLIFLSSFALARGAQNARIKDVTLPCPRCSHRARLIDGNYSDNRTQEIKNVFSAAQFSTEILTKFKELTEKAIVEGYTADKFIKESSSLDPAFKALTFLGAYDKKELKKFLKWIVAMIVMPLIMHQIDSAEPKPAVTHNTVINNTYIKKEEIQPSTPKAQKRAFAKKIIKKRRKRKHGS